jgi:hypothetical protein
MGPSSPAPLLLRGSLSTVEHTPLSATVPLWYTTRPSAMRMLSSL